MAKDELAVKPTVAGTTIEKDADGGLKSIEAVGATVRLDRFDDKTLHLTIETPEKRTTVGISLDMGNMPARIAVGLDES